MVIAVIAADGRTGKYFVEEALSKGFTIKAGVRSLDSFAATPGLRLMECDALKYSEVLNLCRSADVLVSLIGHSKNSPANLQTLAIQNAIKACQASGIKRLISLTGTGVRTQGDKASWIDRILNFIVARVDPNRIKDGIEHANILESSELNWTILRVLKLQNTKARQYHLTPHGPARLITSRRVVAWAIIELITKNTFIKALPVVSN